MLDSKVRYLRIDGTGTHSNRIEYVIVDRFEVVSMWGFEDKQGMESELPHCMDSKDSSLMDSKVEDGFMDSN